MSASRRSEPVSTTEAVKPEPDDPRKPDEVADITTPSWRHVLRKTFREFSADGCTDQAAALTYYGVMSMLPAAIALLSLVSLFGQGQATVDTLLGIARDVVPTTVVDAIEPPLQRLASSPHGGWALVLGLAGALWSASGYVGAFGRTLNRIYDVGEGRPIWKLRPAMLVVTAVALTLVAAAALMIVVSGALAESIGEELGFGDAAVTAWSVAKWPVVVAVVVAVVALLYWATPNVRQPRFRWLSIGAVLAIVTWVVASALFGVYVTSFASYDKTYGSLAAGIVFLLWLWLGNVALLLGAVLDSELERGRELQAGLPAERDIQLPMKDARGVEKAERKAAKDEERGRALRESRGRDDDL